MGQRKGIIYNTIVISIFLAIWYMTTTNIGYYSPPLPNIPVSKTNYDFTPTTLHIVIASESEFTLPNNLVENLENISNAFSDFWHIEVFLTRAITGNPAKIKNSSLDNKRSRTIVFFIAESHQNFKSESVFWVSPKDLDRILLVYVGLLRGITGLGKNENELVNGISKNEEENLRRLAEEWADACIYREVEIFNKIREASDAKISKELYEKILEISNKILWKEDKFGVLRAVDRLNRDTELANEDYFQWDFKLGVYAPLFFPILFPMSAAIYSRLFLRN